MECNETTICRLNPAHNGERGVTTVEYAVMLVLVALAVAAFGAGLSGSVTGVFQNVINFLG
jgi:Flp pilus assembly pilin Flp